MHDLSGGLRAIGGALLEAAHDEGGERRLAALIFSQWPSVNRPTLRSKTANRQRRRLREPRDWDRGAFLPPLDIRCRSREALARGLRSAKSDPRVCRANRRKWVHCQAARPCGCAPCAEGSMQSRAPMPQRWQLMLRESSPVSSRQTEKRGIRLKSIKRQAPCQKAAEKP